MIKSLKIDRVWTLSHESGSIVQGASFWRGPGPLRHRFRIVLTDLLFQKCQTNLDSAKHCYCKSHTRWYDDDAQNGVRCVTYGYKSACFSLDEYTRFCRFRTNPSMLGIVGAGDGPFATWTYSQAERKYKGRMKHNEALLPCNILSRDVMERDEDEQWRRYCPIHGVWFTPWWVLRWEWAHVTGYDGDPSLLARCRPTCGHFDLKSGDKTWFAVGDTAAWQNLPKHVRLAPRGPWEELYHHLRAHEDCELLDTSQQGTPSSGEGCSDGCGASDKPTRVSPGTSGSELSSESDGSQANNDGHTDWERHVDEVIAMRRETSVQHWGLEQLQAWISNTFSMVSNIPIDRPDCAELRLRLLTRKMGGYRDQRAP